MKLSILLELLLIFIIIAFGAAKPISRNERKTSTQVEQKIPIRQETRQNETTEDDDDDDDDDDEDIFGLGSSNDEIFKDTNNNHTQKPINNETEEDEDALDDYDEDEKESEEDVDEGDFLLFGEDLFGFFDDGNKTKKKKVVNKPTTSTSLPLTILSTISKPSMNIIKINKNEQNVEPSAVSIGAVQKVVNQLTPFGSSVNKDSIKITPQHLHLQHTTALLELAQGSTMQDNDSTTMQNIYEIDQSQNQSETNTYIKSEQNTNEETTVSLSEYNDVLNKLKVKKDTQVTLSPSTSNPSKKNPQKEDDSLFGLVESLISNNDEDQKTEDENDDTVDSSGEDEEEVDNEEETLIEQNDEETAINDKKKPSGVIGSIGESFNLFG